MSQANAVTSQTQALEKKNDLHSNLIAETTTLSITLKALNSTSPASMLFTDIMPIISRDKTSSISITNITYALSSAKNTKTITLELTGVATTRDSLASFINILKGEPSISSVTIPISDYAADTNVPFTITIIAS